MLVPTTEDINIQHWQHVQWNALVSGMSVTYLRCRGTNKQAVSVVFSTNDANFLSVSSLYLQDTRFYSCLRESYCANEFVCVWSFWVGKMFYRW